MKEKIPNKRNLFIISISLLFMVTILMVTCKTPNLTQQSEKASTYSKTNPVVTLPADADPNGPDWKGIDLTPRPPVLPLTPQEQAKKFVLQPGYAMQPILTDPQIDQPAAISFDGNGRMFVLELRSYMLDADATDELEPTSRISRWEDKDNDGVYETGTVFVDSLVFVRFVFPYGADCILTMESNANNVYKYTDTNKDGIADKKELFTTNFGRSGNVEHQQSFLFWGMDNWLYSTYNTFRVRYDGLTRETTGANGAAWGVTQDDDGKIWFQGGASGVPSYFQFPIHYGRFTVEDQLAPGFNIPWGAAVHTADMQGGMDQVRMPEGTLNSTTGGAGNDVFRGTKLPKELIGQYFYGEVVARIVRQVNPVVKEGLTQLHNVYQDQQQEFIRSTDPLFRPVDMTTAPDGTMYITDMYHGIIQEGEWAQKGTYLRTKIEQLQLDKAINMGRIWRLTYKGLDRDKTQPKMLDETAAQLITHLDNPNGWWRDMAQQLIILKGDKSVVPALEQMARADKNLLARFHAMWTLEGLGALNAGLVRELMKDSNPRLQIQSIRASETLYKAGDNSFANDYKAFTKSTNTDIAIQAMMTMNTLKVPDAALAIKSMVESNKARGVQVIGNQILNPPKVTSRGINVPVYTASEQGLLDRGAVIFNELCSECHGETGKGTPVSPGVLIAPALAGNPRVQGHYEYITKVLLKGLTGPIEGKNYAGGVMVAMADNDDEWISSIASYVRNNFTNTASFITPEDVSSMRKKVSSQKGNYKYDELVVTIPQVLLPEPNWKITASHSKATVIGGKPTPSSAFNFEGWTTGVAQVPNLWFQIELPNETELSGIEFKSPTSRIRSAQPTASAAASSGPPPFTSIETFPSEYIVQTSTDGQSWSQVAKGKGSKETMVSFDPVKAKFLKITQTGIVEDARPWSMVGMKVYQAGK